MSTKPNPRRGHERIQDGGPHGGERKRWAIGWRKRKRRDARAARRAKTPAEGPIIGARKPYRVSRRAKERT